MSDCGCILQGECTGCKIDRLTRERDEARKFGIDNANAAHREAERFQDLLLAAEAEVARLREAIHALGLRPEPMTGGLLYVPHMVKDSDVDRAREALRELEEWDRKS